MKLEEIKPLLSKYNRISLRLKNDFDSMTSRYVEFNLLKDVDEKYSKYEVLKIETYKNNTLTITLHE